MKCSIIIPVLNEEAYLVDTLRQLQSWQQQGHEVVVVDGGSTDASLAIAAEYADLSLSAPAGRARQMNHGAEQASGDILLFLHADTLLPENAITTVLAQLQNSAAVWGRFDIRFKADGLVYILIARMMNLRSRVTSVVTGDQGMFVNRKTFEKIGGFPDIALMEDVAISKQLRKQSAPLCLKQTVVTSARRWQHKGIWKTIYLMWLLRWRYWRGTCPGVLAREYER